MTHDIFFSICQNEVDGRTPTEREMWSNFFSQVEAADRLGFGCAWVAETHLSTEVQKRNPQAVVPSFKGEIGLNTDILQLATRIFARTKSINAGSAIRNILCNGGPMAHAEAVKTFLSLHEAVGDGRKLELGFASGRFPYSVSPYGIRPRNEFELANWSKIRGLVFQQATEIFLRFLRGDIFSSNEIRPMVFEGREVAPFWAFDKVGVIPANVSLENLRLTIGAHDAPTQEFANTFLPVGVFNLSITSNEVIEATQSRMSKVFNTSRGPWTRAHMPRTLMVFPDRDETKARAQAAKTLATYWQAMEGTVDPAKVDTAVNNALVGTPSMIIDQMKSRLHPDDRLMLWFDLNNHDNESVVRAMRMYMEEVAPHV